jgi:hypothetical protein
MPEYIFHEANPDDYNRIMSRMQQSYVAMTGEEWARYFRSYGIATRAQLGEMQAKIKSRITNDESTWWQKLLGQIWYQFVLPKRKDLLTPRNLLKVLSKLDHLLPYMPNDFWETVLRVLDKAAEYAYDKMDK